MSGDVHVLTGLDAIINPDNAKPGLDLKELERQLISGGLIDTKIKEPQDKFYDVLSEAASQLGISFRDVIEDDGKKDDPPVASKSNPAPWFDEPEEEPEPAQYFTAATRSPPPRNALPEESIMRPKYSQEVRTNEQQRREHIDNVMGISSDTTEIFEREKREDAKCAMLAEIDSLLEALSEEDVDLSRIPQVTQESEYTKVESVLRTLRYKNDHTRYCSFAEEFMIFGAYALEDIFDGKKTYFGQYNPDLSGWHNNVNVKLKRMRHDTGQIVSGVMHEYNIGPGFRVLLELIPNMILYSKMKKQQYSDPGVYSDEEMQAAANRIREMSG